ncbi:Fe-S cluster assembly protein SufD [Rhizobium sp. PAMB 3174]
MNMQAQTRLTTAETALIEAYAGLFGQLPGDGAVTSTRDRLMHELKVAGLPTRRIEAWHYTDLKTLLKTIPANVRDVHADVLAPLVAGASVQAIVQGKASLDGAIDGVSIKAYSTALASGTAAEGLSVSDADDAIGRINGAFVRDGLIVEVSGGADIGEPIELQSVHAGGQVHGRIVATFGAGAKATVIERHMPMDEAAAALVSSVSDIKLEDGAEVTWIIQQAQGADDTHLGQINIDLGKDSKLFLFVLNVGGKLVRQEIHGVTTGEGADLKLRGVNLLGDATHTDVTLTLGHDLPNTTSTEVIRNVVFDNAKGIFQGQIRVAPDAQKTDARMACNTLLMSDEGEFSVKPELEIFADDVQCAHGATVADIDHTHLFYLMARGISEAKARGLLIKAFVAEIVEELEDEAIVEALEGVIDNWLEQRA